MGRAGISATTSGSGSATAGNPEQGPTRHAATGQAAARPAPGGAGDERLQGPPWHPRPPRAGLCPRQLSPAPPGSLRPPPHRPSAPGRFDRGDARSAVLGVRPPGALVAEFQACLGNGQPWWRTSSARLDQPKAGPWCACDILRIGAFLFFGHTTSPWSSPWTERPSTPVPAPVCGTPCITGSCCATSRVGSSMI